MPAVGPDDVLIRVAAAGINRPDLMQREGKYAPPAGASDIPGLEVAGTVHAVGPSVSTWQVGDWVCALVAGGGYAESCAAPAGQCLPVPDGTDFISAAALPETTFTVWTNVFERGRLARGESLLVHGGSSGIGTTAIQIAHASRRAGVRHCRYGRQMRGVRSARSRASHQLSRNGLRRRGQRSES